MSEYTKQTDDALTVLKEWQSGRDNKTLPDSPWKLPKDCPLWKMGLTYFQAMYLLAALRHE